MEGINRKHKDNISIFDKQNSKYIDMSEYRNCFTQSLNAKNLMKVVNNSQCELIFI